jgi:hypothetical protein
MKRRSLTTLLLSAATLLVAAQAAVAAERSDYGEGWFGESNDLAVTYAGFIMLAGFPLLIFALSMLQRSLDKRKEARTAAARARQQRADVRGGW